jgi:hypothetical protein
MRQPRDHQRVPQRQAVMEYNPFAA